MSLNIDVSHIQWKDVIHEKITSLIPTFNAVDLKVQPLFP